MEISHLRSRKLAYGGKYVISENVICILYFVDRASLYNLVNKTNLVHNLFLVYLYVSISTRFGRIWAHHQEKQLCLCEHFVLFILCG